MITGKDDSINEKYKSGVMCLPIKESWLLSCIVGQYVHKSRTGQSTQLSPRYWRPAAIAVSFCRAL